LVFLLILLGGQFACQPPAKIKQESMPAAAHPASPFLGRWDLTIHAPDRTYPSWLEVSEEAGILKARFVGRWGNARPLPKVELQQGEMVFVSPKEEEGSQNDLVFRGRRAGASLTGSALGPDNAAWRWTGEKAPELKAPGNPQWGEPITLFNGKNISGWIFDPPGKPSNWKVKNGCLINSTRGPNLVTSQKFQDFKLHIEVNCPVKANSGFYLRGRYEVQVEDDSLAEPPTHRMGAVYGFLAPSPEQPRLPGVWQSFDVILLGRSVTILQNGKRIIDNQEIPGITGGALDSEEGSPGPIYLQGDHAGIAYRNIVLTPTK
jgi:hypothetical protein